MYSLRLLGVISLEGPSGPVSGRVTQRRRLALLALLGAATDDGWTRDKLIGLLWPETTDEQARRLLSDSLYVLRRELGEDAVTVSGELLRLNSEVVRTDVGEFEAALRNGELNEAVSLYRGPFLEGFYVGGGAELERWVDGERSRLAGLYRKALETLAQQAEDTGDSTSAVEWWRKLAAHDPYDSRIALRLMEAHVAAGNRGAALEHARVHELLMQEEVGADPAPEVLAYAAQLRQQPDAPNVLYQEMLEEAPAITSAGSDVPPEIADALARKLGKEPEDRYATAEEFAQALEDALAPRTISERIVRELRRPRTVLAGLIVLAGLATLLGWAFKKRAEKRRWAREEAIPEIVRYVERGMYTSAYRLAVEAERFIPEDPLLGEQWSEMARYISIRTNPPGADVYYREYDDIDGDWVLLGTSNIEAVRVPVGLFAWRMEKEGYQTVEAASSGVEFEIARSSASVPLREEGSIPAEMVEVAGGNITLDVPGLFYLPPVELGDYLIDRYEVTNREFKVFVDGGGYTKREYWKHSFAKDERELTWEEAMDEFHDATGRPGPASWEAGDYPDGQDEIPVTGVSWYEAAAYAEFVRKQLPTVHHWNNAAGTHLSASIVPLSNFGQDGPAAVGTYQGMGPFGTRDMAGNVKEWCWNESSEGRRYILGGAWGEPQYLFNEADARSPFDRTPTNGFRLMRVASGAVIPSAAIGRLLYSSVDFNVEPVSEEAYRFIERLYRYDKTELNAVVESIDESPDDWSSEKVTFDAAYGNERVIGYLFLPKGVASPYQIVVYFPGSDAIQLRSSNPPSTANIDFIIKSGRAVFYPVYKGTYERWAGLKDDNPDATNVYRDHVIMWSKDLGRSLDYLETRPELDIDKVAYYGVSWGAGLGAILPALEDRLAAVVLDGGGFWQYEAQPEVDQRTFAPRVTAPVLMINGRLDPFFPLTTSQLPMFRLLGTAEDDKRHALFESGHAVSRNTRIRETLEWLDRYLGPVE